VLNTAARSIADRMKLGVINICIRLYQLCGEDDIVEFCKLSRLRWAGHVIRQDDEDLSKRVLLSEPGGKRPPTEI
jgi:hypothetical protein